MQRCIFEEGMWAQNLRKKGLKLDIATICEGVSQLLTDDLTQEEQEQEAKFPELGYRYKTMREVSFPLVVLQLGYEINAIETEASQEEDWCQFIHTINGCDPEELNTTKPMLDHPECDRVDRTLQGVFAEASLNAAARADCGALV